MTQTQQNFNVKSPGFWVAILTFIFSIMTVAGIDVPTDPNVLAGEIVNTVSQSGWFGLIGVMGSVLFGLGMQIYQKAKEGALNFTGIFGNVNTWIYLATLLGGIAAIQGLNLPSNSLPDLVVKLSNADYFGSLSAIIAIVPTLIRYIRDKRKPK